MELTDITKKINDWLSGNMKAENVLLKELYPYLYHSALAQLRNSNHSDINPTLLVNELYIKLRGKSALSVSNKNHFLAISAKVIRQILIDKIRAEKAHKRGGQIKHITIDSNIMSSGDKFAQEQFMVDWLTLNESLSELEAIDKSSVELIELRFFAGLNIPEIAEVLGTSESTVSRNWQFAKTWLLSKMEQ